MNSSPDLIDYVAFFEVEPDWVHASGWYYGARFSISRGDDQLVVTIAPDESVLSLAWSQSERRRLNLELKMVVGWEIERRENDEHLLLRINTGPQALCSVEYCLLRLKPSVHVDWRMGWGPGWPPGSSLKYDAALAAKR